MLRSNSKIVAEYIQRAMEQCSEEWDLSIEDWESGLRFYALFLSNIAHDETMDNVAVTLEDAGIIHGEEDDDDDDNDDEGEEIGSFDPDDDDNEDDGEYDTNTFNKDDE